MKKTRPTCRDPTALTQKKSAEKGHFRRGGAVV